MQNEKRAESTREAAEQTEFANWKEFVFWEGK